MTATYSPPAAAPANGTSHVGTSPAVGMSVEDAAHALGCSANTVRRGIKRGQLRAERISRPQGYEWRVYLDAPAITVGTSPPETSHAPTSQVPTEVPAMMATWAATLLAPVLATIERLEAVNRAQA